MDVIATITKDASDEPWPLPHSWCWTRLGEIALINPPTSFDGLDQRSDISFVPMAAVSEENGIIDLRARRLVGEVAKGYMRFLNGDVIFAKITPCMENGKIAPVTGVAGGYAAGSTEFHVLRSRVTDQRYLWYWLVSRSFRQRAKRNMSGSAGQLRVPIDWLRGVDFALPPLAEQRRIVARIDALFAEIAEGEAALKEARRGLEVFRRALLKAAVTGELTKDWRAANPTAEYGPGLVARPNDDRQRRRATTSTHITAASLPALPAGWVWAQLGDVGDIIGGVTVDGKRKPAKPTTVPYLRVANVQRGHVDLSEIKTITVEESTAEKLRLSSGDLLLNEGGDRDKIGRGWVWDGSVTSMIHQNHVFRVRLHDPGMNPFFISHYCNEMGRRFFIDQGKQTTNLVSISLSKLSMLPIPLAPSLEVGEILRVVDDALGAASDTQIMLAAASADAARSKQSILKAAFEGRLVPQDPTDEPASALLDRLRAEPPANRPGSRKRRGTNAR